MAVCFFCTRANDRHVLRSDTDRDSAVIEDETISLGIISSFIDIARFQYERVKATLCKKWHGLSEMARSARFNWISSGQLIKMLWFVCNSLPLRGKITAKTGIGTCFDELWFAWNSLPLRGKATAVWGIIFIRDWLWFAWNSLPLRGKATAEPFASVVDVCCDLLEIRYLWEVKQQLFRVVILRPAVVICLKFVTFER